MGKSLEEGAGPSWLALSTPLCVQGVCCPAQALSQALGVPPDHPHPWAYP